MDWSDVDYLCIIVMFYLKLEPLNNDLKENIV